MVALRFNSILARGYLKSYVQNASKSMFISHRQLCHRATADTGSPYFEARGNQPLKSLVLSHLAFLQKYRKLPIAGSTTFG